MKFRKKPVVIEAFQLPPNDDQTRALPPAWFMRALTLNRNVTMLPEGGAHVLTLEGRMKASVGDWIIHGVNGELYPCKPEIFAATYEPAE